MNKYMIIIFLLFLLMGIGVVGEDLNNKLIGKVIILDAGHGGKDKGTSEDGIYESDVNLDIVLKLRDKLISEGVSVLLTRDGDYDLSSPNSVRRKKSDFDNRIKLINKSMVDLYISIHMNYFSDSKYYGAQVFYTKGNEYLAKVMQNSFIDNLNSPLKERKLSDTIYMYKKLEVPGILIECGFLSNDKERELLISDEYQNKIVSTIIDGLLMYY